MLHFGTAPGQFSTPIVPRRNRFRLSLLGNQARDTLCGPRNLRVNVLDSSTHSEIEKLERLRLRSTREGTALRYSSDGEHEGEGGGEAESGELAGNVRLEWDVSCMILVAEEIDTEFKGVGSGGDLVNVR